MRVIARADFDAAESADAYYRHRWPCLQQAAAWARELSPRCAIELGAYRLPILPEADTIDYRRCPQSPTILHDARLTPWPIEDGTYDLFVALQVWEHLDNAQAAAFREVQRIARAAILSFPYLWNCPDKPDHHRIDDARIAAWTCGVTPVRTCVIASRKLYLFGF